MLRKTALLGTALICLFFMQATESSATDLALSFTAIQGGSNPSAQTVNVTNTGKGKLRWTASDDAAWLSLSPTSGTTRRTDVIRVMVNIAGLAANTYTATITLSTSDTTSTAQQIRVTLTVVAPSPSIGRSPTSLSFTAAQGGPNPTPQTIQITNPGLGTLSWSVTDDVTWLSLSPSSGTTTTETDTITVNVTTANLTQNTYRATITVTDPKAVNSPQQIPVTLALTAPESSLAVISWDPNTESDLAGYKVYVGTASRVYGVPVDVGNTTSFKVINLLKGQTYYFAITAYDTEGNESGYSNEVSKTITGGPVTVVGTGQVSVTPNAPSVGQGQLLSISWANIPNPTNTDWIRINPPGAPDASPDYDWVYTTGQASGTVQLPISASRAPGNYEVRLYAQDGWTRLATGGPVTVIGTAP